MPVRLVKVEDKWLNMERMIYCHDYPQLYERPTLYIVFSQRNTSEPPVQLGLEGDDRLKVLAWLDRHTGG
jgi:hypothetical protein